jgi:hypothetical protein
MLCERKTTSEDLLEGTYWRRLLIDPQISIYLNAAKHLGYECVGVYYDCLRKPALEPLSATPEELRKYTQSTKKEPIPRLYANQRDRDETPQDFEARCLAAIAADPEKYYQRGTVVRLEDELREAMADNWQVAGLIRDARRLRIYPRNPDACVQWSRTCDYFNVCTGTARIDDPMMFVQLESAHEELSDAFYETALLGLLTQSAIRTYRSCPRKYFYRYEGRYRLIAEKAKPLRIGTSIHRALEVWSKEESLTHALASIETEGREFEAAKERAMITGYHARWAGAGVKFIWVEKEWRIPLVNPETGAASRSFYLAGKMDGICEVAT